jgi:hypothetical protein
MNPLASLFFQMVCTFRRCFSPYMVQANKNHVCPDIKTQGETTMIRFVWAAILVATSTLLGSTVAIAASTPTVPETGASVVLAKVADTDSVNLQRIDRSSYLDRESFPEFVQVAAWQQYASACYTNVGSCPMAVLVLQGSACTCYFPPYGWASGTAW